MRIAMVVRRLSTSGGTQRLAFELAKQLKERGNTICFFTLDTVESSQFFQGHTFPVIAAQVDKPWWLTWGLSLPIVNTLCLMLAENRDARAIASLMSPEYDIVHAHDDVAYKVSALVKKKNSKVKSVWTMNDMVSRQVGAEKLKEVSETYRLNIFKSIWFRLVDYLNFPYARMQDAIMVLDKRDFEWSQKYFKVPTYIIPAGLNSALFPYAEHGFPSTNTVRLLCMGIFFPHRRFEDVIVAVSLLRQKGINATLKIIGKKSSDVCYARKIEKLITQLQLNEYVQLLDMVTEETLLHEYVQNDVFVFSSHLQSWGLAVFEAMASGLPVVVSETAGASEVLVDGKTALLVPPKNPQAIAIVIERLISDKELYTQVAVQGRKFVENEITWNRYADNVERVYRELNN